jgi:hypothetical protein
MSSCCLLVVTPDGLIVVSGAIFEAAVQAADEPVADLVKGSLMADAVAA